MPNTTRGGAQVKSLPVRLILTIGLLALLLGPLTSATPWTFAVAAGQEIKVGVIMPITGPNAFVGEETTNSWKLIVDQANKSGKLPGQIKLYIEDDRSIPTDGVAAAQKLVTRTKVVAILGPFNSAVAGPVTDYTEKAKIPVILGGAASDFLLQRGYKFIFRALGNNSMQGEQFPRFLVQQRGLNRLVIIHQQTDWGNGLRDLTRQNVEKIGGSIVATYGYEPGATDFYSLLTRVKGQQFDGIVTAALSTELGVLVRQAGELGIPGSKFAAYAADTGKLWELAGKASDGVLVCFNFDATAPKYDNGKKLVRDYQAAYGRMPTLFAAQGWVTGTMLVAGLEKVKTIDSEEIATVLHNLKGVPTAYGPLTFGPTGEAHPMYVFQMMKDGKLITLGSQL
jgi:branched-chain amino acid transport system substrate-binding protein